MKVMILDDEPAVLKALKVLIEWQELKMKPYMFPNGPEALEAFEALAPDIVVTDINMPVMDGLTFIGHLRDRGFEGPVVIVSGYDDFAYAKQAIQFRVEDYILKPIDEEELTRVLNKLSQSLNQQEEIPDYEKYPEDSAAYQILYHLYHHYHENLKLKDMAGDFHMTSAYLGQIIKKATGMLFNDYLTAIRMKAARKMLRTSDAMVYEVAQACGYQDTDYFIRKFASLEGCTPNAYKKAAMDRKTE